MGKKKENEIYDEGFTSHYMRRGFENELPKDEGLYRQIPPLRPPIGTPDGLPQGVPFGPPTGRPPRRPITPPFGPGTQRPPFAPGGQGRRPSGPPPRIRPQRRPSITAVDPGAIRRCVFSFVYIWLDNGREFWAFPVYVGRRSIAGFRWTGFNWVYFGTDLRNIDSFICY